LTAAGRRFLPRAMSALESVRRGVADTKSARDARGGFLTLGLASDLALYLAPAALARFARTHPDVEVTVRSGRSRAVAEALRADEIEVALVSQLVVLPELTSRPLFTEDVPVVVGRGHVFAKRSRVAIADLALSGLVIRDPAAYLHTLTLSYFAEGGTAPRILMELDNTEACKRVVAELALGAPSGGFTGLPFVFGDFNRPRDLYREQASLAIALLVVGTPAWWIHFRMAERAARAAVEERASALRSLYVHVVVFV